MLTVDQCQELKIKFTATSQITNKEFHIDSSKCSLIGRNILSHSIFQIESVMVHVKPIDGLIDGPYSISQRLACHYDCSITCGR